MPVSFSGAEFRPSCRGLLLALFSLCALASPLTAQSGINEWTAIGPDGGYITEVAFHATSQNTVYAKASGGFFRSTDGGSHWQQPHPEVTSRALDFAQDPTDNNRIYLGIGEYPGRVLVSTDAGATFSTLYTFPPPVTSPGVVAISADGNTLYAICNTKVFRSTNRGSSWQQRTDVGIEYLHGANQALVDPSDANTLYLMRNEQLLATHDGGSTWTNIAPPSSSTVNDLAINPANSNELWAATVAGLRHSTDRGASWSLVRTGWMTALALDPRSPSTVYVGVSDGNILRRSGATWTDITGDLGSFWPHAIDVSPHDSAKLVVANNRGLWITTNGGGNWARSNSGLRSSFIAGFAVTNDRIYATGNALARLNHGSDAVAEIDPQTLFQTMNSQTSAVSLLTPVIDSAGGLIAAMGNRIARSLDEGVSWNLTSHSSTLDDYVVDLAATTSAPSIYYASSAFTLQRSTDQGASWQPIVTGLPADLSPGLIAIAPSQQSILYAGPRDRAFPDFTGKGVYKSIDGGDTWTPANTGIAERAITAIAVHPTNPDIVYIGTAYSLMKTVNGGSSWSELRWWSGRMAPQVAAIAIDPRAPDKVYVASDALGSDSEVARTTDGGATWAPLAAPVTFFPWAPTALAIDNARPDTLLVGTGTGGIRQITLRPDLQPDLAIQMTQQSTPIPLLAPTQYRFTVSNLTSVPTGDVETTIQLPPTATGVTATANIGTCTVVGLAVKCTAPPLDATETINITVSMTPTERLPLDIAGSVSTDRVDAQWSNNSVTHTTFAREQADVGVAVTGPAGAQPGASLQYIVTIANSGPSPATDTRAVVHFAPGMTLAMFSTTAGTCLSASSRIECDIGTLNVGASVTLTVTGSTATAGTNWLNASISRDGIDDNTSNNLAQASTNISAPTPESPSPPVNNGNSGGGGGGGSVSPLMLLGLLALLSWRGQRRKPLRPAYR